MTREEAIAYGKRCIDLGLNDETQAFCELAIKALEQEPCEDCISRQAVLDEMDKRHAEGDCITKGFINSLPSVTLIRPTGRWIGQREIGFGEWEDCYISLEDGFLADDCHCSECGEEMEKGERGIYCPNCGAKMEEVSK